MHKLMQWLLTSTTGRVCGLRLVPSTLHNDYIVHGSQVTKGACTKSHMRIMQPITVQVLALYINWMFQVKLTISPLLATAHN